MINYTIIIPHKNSADLLEYCLSTIPVRDDVQVIVVDDNSDVDKVDFVHFPKWNGANYECYFTKEGKGAGYARNVGLEHAKGKWVLFVDADDYLTPNADSIFEENIANDADVIFFRPKSVMLYDRQTSSDRAKLYNERIDRYFVSKDETELRVRFFSPTCKFTKHELIERNNIRFEEIQYSNDNLFAVSIGCVAHKIVVKDEYFYVITECDNSLHSGYCTKPQELKIRASAFYQVCLFIKKYNYPLDQNVIHDFLSRMWQTNKDLYAEYFNKFRHVLGYSRIQLIRKEFCNNKPISRIKRSLYALLITR